MNKILTISVDQPSPFPSPGAGESAIGIKIVNGIMTGLVQLPDIQDGDIAAINGDPVALALLQSDRNPIGLILVALLSSQTETWPLCAPLLDDMRALRDWAENPPESNIFLIALIDSNTNIVKAIRTLGLPADFFESIRAGILSVDRLDYGDVMLHASENTFETVWTNGKQWLNDSERGEFVRQE